MITDYATLQAAVANWVERSDLTTLLPTFIANAEAKANRVLRERQQQGQSTASVSAGLTALPNDWRQAITIQLRADASEAWTRLEGAPSDVLAGYDSDIGATGRPQFWSVLGPQLQVYPAPDRAYTVLMTYFKKVPALSDANPTNWLLEEGPDVYLDGALAAFHDWNVDPEQAQRFAAKFENGLIEVISQTIPPPAKLRVDRALVRRGAYDITRDI